MRFVVILDSDIILLLPYPHGGDIMTLQLTSSKEKILHRLKIAQGHLNKLLTMVEADAYCIDVLHQSDAVQKALHHIDNIILENHLKTCTTDAIRQGRSDEAVTEVMNVFKKRQK